MKYSSRLFSLISFLAAVLLFVRTLNFPLMYDTLLHTQLADGQTGWSVFLPNEQFGFYRPLVFLPIVLFQNLLGQYPVFLFHLINVVTHGLNAALVTRLVWKLSGEKWQALAAGLLFASYPFAYQAIAIYGNNPYLTATFFMLLGVNLSLSTVGERVALKGPGEGVKNNQLTIANGQFLTGKFALPVVFLLGVLVHETAVLLVPFVLFLSWLKSDDRSIPTLIRQHLPLLIVCVVYLAIYPFLPRGGGPVLDFGGNELTPKILLFLQTAAWPAVLALFQALSGRIAILLGFAVLVGWVGYRLYAGCSSTLLLGIVWFVLASVLVGVTLPTYYIEDGARLLYPAGVGVALIWAGLIIPKNLVGFQNLRGFIVIGLIILGGAFNLHMIGLYDMGSQPLQTLNQVVADTEPEAVMLVNMPQWVAWPDKVFPAGTEFAPVLGSHLFALEFVRANTGQTPEIIVLDVPEALAQTEYTYGVYKVGSIPEYAPAGDKIIQVVASEYGENGPVGQWRGEIGPSVGRLNTWSAGGMNFSATTACDINGSVVFETTIQPDGPLGDTQSLFVQVLSEAGQLVAQSDGPPLGLSPGRLRLSDRVQAVDRRILSPEEASGSVLVGVYDFTTGERAEAISAVEGLLADNAYRVEVVETCSDS